MEILKKILELISEFLESRKQKKIENEEIEAVKIDQEIKTSSALIKVRKNAKTIEPPKKDDFFNDDSW